MNLIFLSPHFPPNFYLFCEKLKQNNVCVLGIAEAQYDHFRPELKHALTEYYRVNDMQNYDQLLRACGYFTHWYGKIDRVESHNEFWLETEAKLRTDFNIHGIKADTIANITRKSKMKILFQEAGVAVAQGQLVKTVENAKQFVKNYGYPVVLKPDRGVGAAATWKAHHDSELEAIFTKPFEVDYIIEKFIQGTLLSFDGLTDANGNIVFFTSHVFSQGIMETVNEDRDIFYYSLRDIPEDLEKAGRNIVKTFNVREKFFHIEFFRTTNKLIGLEVNIRPPGGLTMDMFNYANDIDLYREWANIVAFNEFQTSYSRPWHCAYIGRKQTKTYVHSHEEIMNTFKNTIVHYEPIQSIFSPAIGNFGYIARAKTIKELSDISHTIQETKKG
ncbi:MAG: ATP-grasp domain-containing protein [Desulfobacterales bacterium]|nr:ATP-grasp domain-containing protein [Desulfobacterales bacterium]